MLHTACTQRKRPAGMTPRVFIAAGMRFCDDLDMHHSIEETRVFPHLARKMPVFGKNVGMVRQHREIHRGVARMREYLGAREKDGSDVEWEALAAIMNSFGEVLWTHLDEEVKELGAEKMRVWTLAEMDRMPM